MKHRHRWLWRFTILATISGLLVLELSSRPSYAEAERFFHARLRLAQTGPPVPAAGRCPPSEVLVSLDGDGFARRLGRVSVVASHCIEDDPASIPFTAGTLAMTGRRGQLMVAYEGTDVDGALNGTFVVTGGTGVYAGATGSGILTGIGSSEEERGVVRLKGRISVPKR